MPFDSAQAPAALQESALTYVNDNEPGITRRRAGRGFSYRNPDGSLVRDHDTLERIRKLAIPPAYEAVWICPDPNGHIQATGRDAKGRKQYRYHPDWTALQAETKYARMAAFGRALPAIRARVDEDLGRRGLPREKVLAAVVRLLELTLIRVGNDEYARANKHFGLTTMRDRHAKIEGSEIRFEFHGKSGIKHKSRISDRRLARVVKACQDVPGQRLFQYVDDEGQSQSIGSADVNAYLREITGEHFTAKDFRTWAGTIAAAKALALQPAPGSATEAKRLVTLCMKATAGLLGNTPAVCRSSYVHPAVLEAFTEHRLPPAFAEAEGDEYEQAVLEFLDKLAEEVSDATGLSPQAQVDASNP
ncbi:MAG TPA: DNA topoisomerase IB [Caulobacteraceae bacterium]|jgi:DNA topoisomerase-1